MKELIPLLKVRNLNETLDFYRDALGFELCWREGDTASVRCGGACLMLSTGSNLGETPTLSGTIYFYPDDVDQLWERLRHGADVAWELQTMSYGTREFGIRDPNGYCLAFAEVLEEQP